MKINGFNSPYILSIFLTLGLVVSSASLLAQNAEEDQDVYTLDPFSISEDENVGYEARSSLAGT
ncbi:MAG: hypothetical protein CMI18_10420, partial [Opitutaceae bacterium]|nr:hypothetical protein [Opitutaceae bacterium]